MPAEELLDILWDHPVIMQENSLPAHGRKEQPEPQELLNTGTCLGREIERREQRGCEEDTGSEAGLPH